MRIRQLVKLSSYLLSDGGISPRGKNSYTIYFSNNDASLVDNFQIQLKKCIHKEGYKSLRKNGSTFVKIHSKNLAKELFKVSKSYRTKACKNNPICPHIKNKRPAHINTILVDGIEYPAAEIPVELLKKDKTLAKDFLRIYASCDGGVSVSAAKNKKNSIFLVRKIFIEVAHPTLKQQIYTLLKHLKYNPKCYKTSIRLTTKEDFIKFHKEIGFIKKSKISKHSKNFVGYEKNKVLKMLIDSYNNPQNLLNLLLKN